MRTGGPCLPSGRRSVSSCSGRIRRRGVEQRAHLVGHQGRRGGGLALVDTGQRLVDEHDVGVAAVADLAAAVAPHPDDQHPGRQRRAPGALQLGGRGLQGAGDRGVGDVGQRVADVVDGQRLEDVRGRDPEQLAAAQGAHGHDSLGGVVVAGRGGQELRGQRARLAGAQLGGVGEQGHAVRGPQQQLGGVPAAGQDPGHPLGTGRLVAQQAQVPGRPAEVVADPPEPEQPGVGVRGVGEPSEHDRQQGPLDRRTSAHPGRQGLDVVQRPRGVAEAQGIQALAGRLRGQPGLPAVQARDGVEQGSVEELLVDAADLVRPALPCLDELLAGIDHEPHRAPEAPQVLVLAGHHVRAHHPVHLDPVLQGAQEPVGAGQPRGVLAPHVPPGGQGLQGGQGGRAAQHDVAAPVHQLQQLHAELDVAQPALAQLELALGVLGRHVALDPLAHPLHLGDEPIAVGRRPDERQDRVDVGRPELLVARDGAGLEQGLELPGLGPALVVADVAAQGAHQRPGPALRAQVRVDLPDRALGGGLAAQAHHRRGQGGRRPQGLGLVDALGRLGDEDHVDVADVVQLAPAALAHRDDRQPGLRGVVGELLAGCDQGTAQDRVGQLRQAQGGQLEVARRGPRRRWRSAGRRPCGRRAGRRRPRHPPRRRRPRSARAGPGHRGRGVLEQDLEVLGVTHQVLGERDGDPRRQGEPAPGPGSAATAAIRSESTAWRSRAVRTTCPGSAAAPTSSSRSSDHQLTSMSASPVRCASGTPSRASRPAGVSARPDGGSVTIDAYSTGR